MATVTTTVKYRSANLKPSAKARWVSKWNEFHKAFPDVTMDDWCSRNGLSVSTFSAWKGDVRYNKELREKMRNITGEDMRDYLSKLPSPDGTVEEEKEPEGELKVEMRIEPDGKIASGEEGPYVLFQCPEFRLKISKAMPADEINKILEYAFHAVDKPENYRKVIHAEKVV